jgi:outer membrane receptor protein involved in Fe transport
MLHLIAAAFLILTLGQPPTLTGSVKDGDGLPVVGALVEARAQDRRAVRGRTDAEGRFSLPALPEATEVIVRGSGFAEAHVSLADGSPLSIVLQPAALTETVTVTAAATEQRSGDLPASIALVGREALDRSAGLTADDVLRQIPSFSLFRRSSSLVSHPTTQGVSLRGIGPSGVSRTLVLLDDVPFNDPFGGWVYWTRVPMEAADRIEVVEGAASSLYGTYAMGGVINILTPRPQSRNVDGRVQYGDHDTRKVDVSGGTARGPWGVQASVAGLRTDGYPVVIDAERGKVDTSANVNFTNATAVARYDPSPRLHLFVRGGYFDENRHNGKSSTIDGTPEANDTTWRSLSAGVRHILRDASELSATAFGDSETFHSNFLAVPAATPSRSVGRMTLRQTVPVLAFGANVRWSRALGSRQFFTAGLDSRRVRGDSEEDALDATRGQQVTLHRVSGGRQRNTGLFVQDLVQATSRMVVTLGARVDRWNNVDGHNRESCAPNVTCVANDIPSLPDSDDTAFSPRIGVLYRVHSRLSAWASGSGAFRAPTLNELYRQFRVGTVLTLANSRLVAERLRGFETGATLLAGHGLQLRTTWFDDGIRDPVSNVTIATAGVNVTQQRQNLGRTRVRGIQADAEWREGARWRLGVAYTHMDARVTENAAVPDIVGNTLPQVPRHRGSLHASFTDRRLGTFAAQLLATGSQFDDDRNTPARLLPAFTTLDFTASRAVWRGVNVFFAAQNLLDKEYIVGTLPTTIGGPRFASFGVTIRSPRR